MNTGSRSSCKSSWGVFDMVGNVIEWVADWADLGDTGCTNSTAFGFAGTGDFVCFGGNGSPQVPGALVRGGRWFDGVGAGVSNVGTGVEPSGAGVFPPNSFDTFGFRCAR